MDTKLTRRRWPAKDVRGRASRLLRPAVGALLAFGLAGGAALAVAPAASAATLTEYNNTSAQQGVDWGQMAGVRGDGAFSGGSVTNVTMGSMFVNSGGSVIGPVICVGWNVPSTDIPTSPTSRTDQFTAVANVLFANHLKAGDPAGNAVIQWVVHEKGDAGYAADNGPIKQFWATSSEFAPYRAQGLAWWNEAAAEAGPYKVQPNLSMAASGTAGTIKGSLLSAAGNALSKGTSTYVITGPAVFSNGSKTISAAPGASLPFTVTGTGTVSVTQTVTGLPGTSVIEYAAQGTQTKIGLQPTRTSAAGKSADAQVFLDMQPVATSTAPTYLEKGQPLSDVLHVTTADGKPWIAPNGKGVAAKFDVDWYYSPIDLPAGANIPAGATKVASGTGVATGTGNIIVTPLTGLKAANNAGHYYPVASFTKSKQAAADQKYFKGDWRAGFKDSGEHTIVKFTPQVVTKASKIENGKIYDVVTISHNDPEATLPVTSNLWLTKEGSVVGGTDAAPADAIKVGTVVTKFKGNGTFNTNKLDVPWDEVIAKWGEKVNPNGYWQESIPATESTKPWEGKHQLPNETVEFVKPTIVTKASDNGTVPLVAHDTGVISGTIPAGPGIKVETQVKHYNWDDSTEGPGKVQPLCSVDDFTSPWQTVTETQTKVTYPSHTISVAQTGGYVEELQVTVTKDGKSTTTSLHKGECGAKNETVVAYKPGVPVSPEKPQLLVETGNTATTQGGPNTPLMIGGASALVVLMLAGAGVLVHRNRKKVAAQDPANS